MMYDSHTIQFPHFLGSNSRVWMCVQNCANTTTVKAWNTLITPKPDPLPTSSHVAPPAPGTRPRLLSASTDLPFFQYTSDTMLRMSRSIRYETSVYICITQFLETGRGTRETPRGFPSRPRCFQTASTTRPLFNFYQMPPPPLHNQKSRDRTFSSHLLKGVCVSTGVRSEDVTQSSRGRHVRAAHG